MKNLPEKLYVIADEENIAKRGLFDSEKTFKNDIEYVRKDIAEKMAKEFTIFFVEKAIYAKPSNGSIELVFTEFLTSRKAQNE